MFVASIARMMMLGSGFSAFGGSGGGDSMASNGGGNAASSQMSGLQAMINKNIESTFSLLA